LKTGEVCNVTWQVVPHIDNVITKQDCLTELVHCCLSSMYGCKEHVNARIQ